MFVLLTAGIESAESLARISTEEGKLLRVNRSIQAEGTYGVLKEDWGFRRYLRRGSIHVMTETLLYAFGFNVKKLHNKIRQDRLGMSLFYPNTG